MPISPELSLEEIEWLFPNMHITRSSLKKGDLVPLHAHSGQNGFIYLLAGSCQIATYHSKEQLDGTYHLSLDSDKIYKQHDYALITAGKNVHSILALEDCMILDSFSVFKSHEVIQKFLKVVQKNINSISMIAEVISLEEAQIEKHLLEKVTTIIEIKN